MAAQLTIAAVTPGIDASVSQHRHAVSRACGDIQYTGEGVGRRLHVFLLILPPFHGKGSNLYRDVVAEGHTSQILVVAHTQLAIGVVAPGKERAVGPQRQHMGVSGIEIHNIGQVLAPAGTLPLIDLTRNDHVAGINGFYGIIRQHVLIP